MKLLAFVAAILSLAVAIQIPSEGKRSRLVIGGRPAALGQFPFFARIRIPRKYYVGVCGASLLSARHLLTAAHCVTNALPNEDFEAFLGLVDLNERFSAAVQRSRIVNVAFPRDNPTGNIALGDIAVLTLETPINFTNTVKPTKIVRNDSELIAAPEGTLAGFGKTTWKEGVPSSTDVLLFAEVPFVNHTLCKRVHGKRVTDKDICAGSDGKGQAPGDSGGPFGVYKDHKWIQVGVPSQGFGTDKKKNKPSILTRVSAYCDFIAESTANSFLCS